MKWRTPRGPQLRHCVKVALAAVAAYILTLGERNEYALFSMLGAALVVGGSVGEDLNTSLNRVRGTLAGTVVGITVAYLLGKSIVSLGLSLALLTWVSLGLGWGIPATRVGIAMALVVWFAHTSDATHYAIWRLLNTLIGVSVGFAVSRFVWPIRGRNEIANALDRALKATRTLLDSLASGTASDALLPLQVDVLDAVAAVRTARKNAHLERHIDRTTDLLHTHTVPAVRAAILTLGASVTLEELVHAGVRGECLHAVRQATAALAAEAQSLQAEQRFDEFNPRYESALREVAHPDVDADMRTLLVGLLSELQRIHVALRAIRDACVTTSPGM